MNMQSTASAMMLKPSLAGLPVNPLQSDCKALSMKSCKKEKMAPAKSSWI